jgi:hypothetical protein
MEMRFNIPFQELLALVKALSPGQREKLRQELDKGAQYPEENDNFIDFLLNGPVYSKDDIKLIESNRKGISEWRTKSY